MNPYKEVLSISVHGTIATDDGGWTMINGRDLSLAVGSLLGGKKGFPGKIRITVTEEISEKEAETK